MRLNEQWRNTDIVDGFSMSASQLLVPTSYRALILGQMDVLRRASAMRPRHYIAPLSSDEPVAAYSQNEYEVSVMPGSYVWGLSFFMPTVTVDEEQVDFSEYIHIQITDVCTETSFFSDYARASSFLTSPSIVSTYYPTGTLRWPALLAQPRLIGEPAKLDVEIYNSSSQSLNPQLVIFVAEPALPPDQMERILKQAGYKQ
jgi:hypothetical protein